MTSFVNHPIFAETKNNVFSGPNVEEYGTDVYLLFYKLVFTLAPKGRKQKTFHFKMCFFKKS